MNSCHELKLEPQLGFTEKVHQLYDTFGVRFGVMLVGPAGVGKSSIYRVLSHSLNFLHDHPDLYESESESDASGDDEAENEGNKSFRHMRSLSLKRPTRSAARTRSSFSRVSLGTHLADEEEDVGMDVVEEETPESSPSRGGAGTGAGTPAKGSGTPSRLRPSEIGDPTHVVAAAAASLSRSGAAVLAARALGGPHSGARTPSGDQSPALSARAGLLPSVSEDTVASSRPITPASMSGLAPGPAASPAMSAVKMVTAATPGEEHSIHTPEKQLSLTDSDSSNPYMRVESYVLNPKSVKPHELFGEFNSVTDEWKDGLASGIIRAANLKKSVVVEGLNGGPTAAVMSQHGRLQNAPTLAVGREASSLDPAADDDDQDAQTLRWIVFDGPVDSLWVENMNTVLDDNCMLCLPNGERIRLDAVCLRMLFEVHDLSAASPATISRCGMVYCPTDALGWRPLVKSWLEHQLPGSQLIEPDSAAAAAAVRPAAETTGMSRPMTTDGKQMPLAGISFRGPPAGSKASAAATGAATGAGAPATSSGPALPNSVTALLEKKPDAAAVAAAAAASAAPAGPFRVARCLHPRLSAYILGLFDTYADSILKYVRKACHESIASTDVSLIQATMSLLQALIIRSRLDMNPDVEDPAGPEGTWEEEEDPLTRHKRTLLRLFVFSVVWGIGGSLDASSWELFDEFVQDSFRGKVDFPGKGGVYDYFPDAKNDCRMKRWDLAMPAFSVSVEMLSSPLDRLLIPTIDTSRFGFLIENGLMMGRCVFMSGLSGVGKSVAIEDTLRRLETGPGSVWNHQVYHLSGQTTCHAMQDTLETILVRKRKNKYGAPPGKRCVIFLDDVNLAEKDPYGVQSAIELLRQVMDSQGMFDKRNWSWTWIEDVTFVAACAPPGGGRHPLSSRFVRNFFKLSMPAPSGNSLEVIFGSVLRSFFDIYFTTKLRKSLLDPIVHSSVDIYNEVCAHLLPTPAKSHYTYNLRDLTRVFQGLLLVRPTDCPDRDAWVRLWFHEVERAFSDRLVDA